MGLTKPRAYQIFDIDYKQAVKVITLTDINLTGGAPSQVDGVNLSVNDRVLVAGNDPASENGIYVVTTVGTGSNGTWIRSVDADQTGEIQAGMIVMVTEGNLYDDTQWKLTTDDPITVGVTSLVFEQSSAYAFGTIAVSGQTDIVADTVGDTLNISAGNNIAITTNAGTDTLTISVNQSPSFSGNVTGANLLTGGLVSASGTITGANITGSNFLTGGLISATATITGGNLQTGGTISATGKITGGNVIATVFTGNVLATTVSSSSSITGGNLFTGGEISATGRIQGANITGGNLLTSGVVSATGNITGGNLLGTTVNGNLSGTTASLSGNITGGNLLTSGVVSATGNITGGNLSGTNIAGTLTTASQTNITAVGTLTSLNSGAISSSGNITGANILTDGLISATGNLTSGNLLTGGLISATGTITGSNVNVLSTGNVRYYESDNTNYVAFRAPATIATNVVWTLPATDGTPNTVLTTDGTGTLSWTAGGGGTSSGGFFNSTLTTFPGSSGNADYGNGEAYVGAVQSSDAFGVPIIPNYDCTDPYGSLPSTDLGSVA